MYFGKSQWTHHNHILQTEEWICQLGKQLTAPPVELPQAVEEEAKSDIQDAPTVWKGKMPEKYSGILYKCMFYSKTLTFVANNNAIVELHFYFHIYIII